MGYKGLEIYTIRSSVEEKEEDEEEENYILIMNT
jgi:hypothetical protein